MKSNTKVDPRIEAIGILQSQLIAEGLLHYEPVTIDERACQKTSSPVAPVNNDTFESLLMRLGKELDESSDLAYSYSHMVDQICGTIPVQECKNNASEPCEPMNGVITVMSKIRGLIEFAARINERNRLTSARLVSAVQG